MSHPYKSQSAASRQAKVKAYQSGGQVEDWYRIHRERTASDDIEKTPPKSQWPAEKGHLPDWAMNINPGMQTSPDERKQIEKDIANQTWKELHEGQEGDAKEYGDDT